MVITASMLPFVIGVVCMLVGAASIISFYFGRICCEENIAKYYSDKSVRKREISLKGEISDLKSQIQDLEFKLESAYEAWNCDVDKIKRYSILLGKVLGVEIKESAFDGDDVVCVKYDEARDAIKVIKHIKDELLGEGAWK